MPKNILHIPTLLIFLTLMACEEISIVPRSEKTPVIEAFLMPQLDTLTVTVKYMIPYSGTSDDTLQLPVSHVPLYLIFGTDSFRLAEDPLNPGYYHLLTDGLGLNPGDSIALAGSCEGTPFHSITRIPQNIESLTISKSSIYYTVGDPRSMMQSENILISWSNPQADFYYVVVENMESDPEPLNEMVAEMPVMSFAAPSQADQFQVSMRNIRYFGDHRVIVFHVNPEFADLFDHADLTSNAITSPPGNIEHAMGVFTALTMDTVYFSVYKN